MADRMQGKIAIITGASRGIGAAMAKSFAREGAKVIIASRTQETLDTVAAEINALYPDSILPKACHMGKAEDIDAFFQWVEEHAGTPNVLVNNAATNPYFGPVIDTPEWAWDKTFDVNLKGYFQMASRVAKGLVAKSQPGSLINVASIVGLRGSPLQGVYAMTKAAVISMTQTMAVELGPAGIRSNAIAPGLVETKLAEAIVGNPDMQQYFNEKTALKRHGQPEEIAELAVYLGSDESSYMTGQTLCVDGGYTTT